MKKAINIWSFHGNGSLEEKLKLAAEAGFDGIEIDLTEDGPVHLESPQADLEKIARQAKSIGIELTSLASGLYWSANAASNDKETRERARRILRKQIETAASLGVDAILVIPGSVGTDFIPNSEEIPYDIAYERAHDLIENALPLAEKHGILIGIENVWNKFLLSPLEFRQFIDSFDNPHVAAYLDIGNVVATGYPEHWIPILGNRIKRVHVKDYRRAVGSIDGFVDLFSGDTNWPAVMQNLRATGYQGWIAAEMIPPVPFYKHCPEMLIYNTSRAMDALLRL